MKYKGDIHMKFDVPWLLLSEGVVYFLSFLITFIEDHNEVCPLSKVKQFSKGTLREICRQRLTTSPYIWN